MWQTRTGVAPGRSLLHTARQNILPEVNWLILGTTLPGRVHPFSFPRRQKSKVERLKAKENRRYS